MTRHEARQTETSAQDLRNVIGSNISALRLEHDLTIEQLAAAVGISLRLVQKHMAGDNAPGHANLLRYSKVFGKPVSWFFESHRRVAA